MKRINGDDIRIGEKSLTEVLTAIARGLSVVLRRQSEAREFDDEDEVEIMDDGWLVKGGGDRGNA